MARLFGGASKSSVASSRTTKLVESVLQELGVSPSESAMSAGDSMLWGLLRGSTEVYVRLVENDEDSYVQVTAPTFSLAPGNEVLLYERLLKLNCEELSGAAFGIRGDSIVVCADRSVSGLDKAILKDMIVRVGTYADHYSDMLLAEFGTS